MENKDVNKYLAEIISEAQELNIPVPDNILEEVVINPRPKKRYGCCRKVSGSFQIEISSFVLECEPEKIKGVLAHEVLHTCRGCYDHGNIWKTYAKKMNARYGYNIKRVSTGAEMGIEEQSGAGSERIRYIIKCKSCGREYPRQRYTCVMKKINAYRCNCGGKLEVMDVKK